MYAYWKNGVTLRRIPLAKDADTADGWLADGMVNISGTGQLPQPGDILVFSPSNTEVANGDNTGHVAIVYSVSPPTANQAGSVEVRQSNCVINADGSPQVHSFPLVNQGTGYRVMDNSPNYFGPTVRSLLRYGGGGTAG
jgi:hypothetical protein